MEIFTLEISFPYEKSVNSWVRVIEVKENFSLKQLHSYIQDVVDFDDDHFYEFYIGKTPNNRARTVAKNVKLNEIYPMAGYKLYYLFDFGDCWLFQIKKSRKRLVEDSAIRYPRVVKSVGINPKQYSEYDE